MPALKYLNDDKKCVYRLQLKRLNVLNEGKKMSWVEIYVFFTCAKNGPSWLDINILILMCGENIHISAML